MIEAGKVRSSAQIAHGEGSRVAVVGLEPDVVHSAGSHRIGHHTRRRAQQRLERRGAAAAEARTRKRAVFIDVGNDVRAQRILELLDPFRRADEPPLLGVPGREDDGARGLLAAARERRKRARRLEHTHGAAHIVARARSPGVAMAADHNPFIWPPTAADHADGVPDLMEGASATLGLHVHPRARRPRPDVIMERQPALPALRHGRSGHRLEEAARVPVTHRDDRNLGDVERIFGKASRPFDGRPAGRGGIAVAVHHAAALDPVRVAHRPLGVHVAPEVAVVLRIGIHDEPHRAALLRLARLDAAEGPAVAGDRDLACHTDAEGIECLVVFDEAVVDVDDVRRRVTVPGVAVEGRDLRTRARLC